MYVDDDNRCIYIANFHNHRIVAWKFGAKNSTIVAGGKGRGNRLDQLYLPNAVVVDKKR